MSFAIEQLGGVELRWLVAQAVSRVAEVPLEQLHREIPPNNAPKTPLIQEDSVSVRYLSL